MNKILKRNIVQSLFSRYFQNYTGLKLYNFLLKWNITRDIDIKMNKMYISTLCICFIDFYALESYIIWPSSAMH